MSVALADSWMWREHFAREKWRRKGRKANALLKGQGPIISPRETLKKKPSIGRYDLGGYTRRIGGGK